MTTLRRRGPVVLARLARRRVVASLGVFALALPVSVGLAAPTPHVRSELATTARFDAPVARPGVATTLHPSSTAELVGFTWDGGQAGTVSVRAHTPAGWSGWTAVEGNPDEGPDAGSPENHGKTSAGPVWVGRDADRIDVRVDAGELHGFHAVAIHSRVTSTGGATPAGAAAAQPAIHPRTDWGRPEAWENDHPETNDCASPSYASTVRYGIVHHTDNANTYAQSDVPSLILGIWRFHTFTNGWCDIGYNFLVDRFGGVWEGRAGGIDKAVVGAHAGGFNSSSTGISLIGNFSSSAVPGSAYGTLVSTLAWKLALHGANPTGALTVTPAQFDQSRYPAGQPVLLWTLLGHRDVDSTDCPGGLAYGLMDNLRYDVQRQMAAAQSPDSKDGYWMVASDGGIFAFGTAGFYGSTGSMRLNKPIVGMAPTPSGHGYWLVASDGGIFAFGDAGFYGSTGSMSLNKPIVGMSSTPSGHGYWLVASDGGIFAFGDARFQGSMGGSPLNKPVVGMATDPATGGYWLVASDGGIFAFNAPFYGSTGSMSLVQPIVGMTSTPDGGGYRFVAADGGVFSFGNAPFAGSAAGGVIGAPVVAMAQDVIEGGYRIAAGDGALFSFGAARFLGSPLYLSLNHPVVGMAAAPPPPTTNGPNGTPITVPLP